MNALQLSAFGRPTTAPELVKSESPEPGAGEVLVALEAAPIKPIQPRAAISLANVVENPLIQESGCQPNRATASAATSAASARSHC